MGENWEVVGEAAGELQAEILRGLLESQGIPVWLNQEGAGKAYGIGIGKLGNVQILVPSTMSNRAKSILDDYYAGKFFVDDDEEETDEAGE